MPRTSIIARLAGTTLVIPFLIGSSASASAERVLLLKVDKNKVTLVRSNGSTYLVEKGLGCISLPQHEGRHIIVESPARFLGVAARLIIPDIGQDCPVIKAEEVKVTKKLKAQPRAKGV